MLDLAVDPGDKGGAGAQWDPRFVRQVGLVCLLEVLASLRELDDDFRPRLEVVSLSIRDVQAGDSDGQAGLQADGDRMPSGPPRQVADHTRVGSSAPPASVVEVHRRLEDEFLQRHMRVAVPQGQPVAGWPAQCAVGQRVNAVG